MYMAKLLCRLLGFSFSNLNYFNKFLTRKFLTHHFFFFFSFGFINLKPEFYEKLFLVSSMLLLTSGVFANDIAEKEENQKEDALVERCCRRSASNDRGDSWTARRCVDHPDGAQAMGAACALAQADADKMKKLASIDATITD
jgi:hypothetical protein